MLLAFNERPCGRDASIDRCRPRRLRVAVREPVSKFHIAFFLCVSVFMKPFSDQIKLFANCFKNSCVDCFSGLVRLRCSRTVGCGHIKANDL
jgi:hypothetical protein